MNQQNMAAPTMREPGASYPENAVASSRRGDAGSSPAGPMGPLELAAYKADWRNSLRFRNGALYGFRFADYARESITLRPFFAQKNVLSAQPGLFQGSLDQQQKVIGINRFLQKIVRAVFHRLDGFIDRTIRRHDNNRNVAVGIFCRAQYVDA